MIKESKLPVTVHESPHLQKWLNPLMPYTENNLLVLAKRRRYHSQDPFFLYMHLKVFPNNIFSSSAASNAGQAHMDWLRQEEQDDGLQASPCWVVCNTRSRLSLRCVAGVTGWTRSKISRRLCCPVTLLPDQAGIVFRGIIRMCVSVWWRSCF